MIRYLRNSVLVVLGFTLAMVALNYYVDPYAIYRFQSADTERISRVDQFYHMRLTKPWQIAQRKPGTLLIGSSRAGVIAPSLRESDSPAYNMSMPGMTPAEMERFIHHAHAHAAGGLQRLTLAIEPASFISAYPEYRPGFKADRLLPGSRASHLFRTLQDGGVTLLSGDATLSSLSVVAGGVDVRRHYHPDGSWTNEGVRLIGENGYLYNANALLQQLGADARGMKDNLAVFARILAFCHQNNIDTRIFISPDHLFFVDLWSHIGLSESWTEFHKGVVSIVESEAENFNAKPFAVYGFNIMRGVVDEPISLGQGDPDAWFKDGIHFDRRLGEIITSTLWQLERHELNQTPYRLTKSSLAEYLISVETMQASFLKRQSEVVQHYHSKLGLE